MDQLPEPGTTLPAIARGPWTLNHDLELELSYDEAFHHPMCREDRGQNRSRGLSVGAASLRHHPHPETIEPPGGLVRLATARRSELFPPEEHESIPAAMVVEWMPRIDHLVFALDLFG